MSLILNESVVLAKTRSQDLKSVLKLNCWGSGIKDVSLVRQLINVEVIGLSCNEISTLEDFAHCKRLKELILRGNKIKSISEVAHLQKLPALTSLWLQDNPCVEATYNYRKVVLRALPQLKVLDNKPVTREELQEIAELGDEIYEEVPYESGSSHSSGPHSQSHTSAHNPRQQGQSSIESQQQQQHDSHQTQQPSHSEHQQAPQVEAHQLASQPATPAGLSQCEQSLNDISLYQPTQEAPNESFASSHLYSMAQADMTPSNNRGSRAMQPRLLPQGSTGLNNNGNHHYQAWSGGANNNNNNNNNSSSGMNILPKGGKSRNANILSAVLCLVKELDYVGCEVVQTALNCRMEETQ